MSTEKQIIISGVGGQGMILCGTLIAQAAVLHDGRRATLSSEYGVETRAPCHPLPAQAGDLIFSS